MKNPINRPVIKTIFTLLLLCVSPLAALADGSKVVASPNKLNCSAADNTPSFGGSIKRLSALPQSQQPLKVEDALHALSLAGRSPIVLSPDGQLVAYTLADRSKLVSTGDTRHIYFDNKGVVSMANGCDVWIANTQTGQSENLTGGKGTSWAPVWSPDGKNLAFYSDRGDIANLWVWERASKQMRQLSNAIVRPFFNFQIVRWSADSKKILVKVLPEGMDLERAEDMISGPAVVKKDRQEEQGPSATKVTVTVYSNIPKPAVTKVAPKLAARAVLDEKWMNRYSGDLALVDLASGSIEHVAKDIRPLGYWFSPDGKYIAYTHCKGTEENSQRMVYQIYLLNLADRSSRILAPRVQHEYGVLVSWSPDSKSIAYIGNDAEEHGDCFVVPIAGGPARNLTKDKHPSFSGYCRAPLWEAKSNFVYLISAPIYGRTGTDTIWKASVQDASYSVLGRIPNRVVHEIIAPQSGCSFWSPDQGRSLVVEAMDEETMKVGFYKVDLASGKPSMLFEESALLDDLLFRADSSQDGQTLVYVKEDSQHPEDIWVSGADFSNRHRVSNINPAISAITLGTSRLIDWRSQDGTLLHGALLLPANYNPGKRYPLIVFLYGGSFASHSTNRFGLSDSTVENLQLLATRGYAVLMPDCPLGKGTPMSDLIKTINPGMDKVVQMGIADPDRIGVMGHSYGGYSTLALIVQTNRFHAAVDSAGTCDLISSYGHMNDTGASPEIGWCETGQGGMVGSPWQFRDRYIQNSPIFYLDHVTTPLLIINGELDDVTPHAQAEEVFVGLRRLDKKVVYAKYLGEGHWQGTWSYANTLDYWNRVIQWFDQHLQTRSSN